MTHNSLTKRVVDELIKYLAAGGIIKIDIKEPALEKYLTSDLKVYLNQKSNLTKTKVILRYMKNQNLIEYEKLPAHQAKLRLTVSGIKRAQRISLAEISIPKPKRWDKKWRVVLFDIPETQRQARNALSSKLKALGFKQIQRSVWVHPFPCQIEIEYIKHSYKIEPYVTLAEIDKIDGHHKLVRQFQHLVT